jgi:lipoprotein-anchoring transpeptidase ErfK/SrfK
MFRKLISPRTAIVLKLVFGIGVAASMLQAAPAPQSASAPAAAVTTATAATGPGQAVPKPSAAIQGRMLPPEAERPMFAPNGVLAIDRWLRPGEFAWNSDGVPAGETVIAVDLRQRLLAVYRAGYEIGRTSIIYGADDKPTPTGAFPILQKKRHHVSNLYGAPMPYMMRLTMDGVAIHAAEVEDASATHGCIGIPEEFAAMLFAEAKLGDRVFIVKGA